MANKSEDLLETWGAFFVSHALSVRQIEENLKGKAPLSLDEYDVLLGISRAPLGRIRYSELASITVFTRSGITRIARRLEQRGLIERVTCEEDRRGAFAILTSKGKETMKKTWSLYSVQIIELLDPCLDRSEVRELGRLLEKIINRLRPEPLLQIGGSKHH